MVFPQHPFAISVFLGLLSCVIAVIIIIATIIKTLAFGEEVTGFPTLLCSIFFMGGLQLFCTGILGTYLSKTYLEVKNRPIYLVRETEENCHKPTETSKDAIAEQ